jgi:hypothetical protein
MEGSLADHMYQFGKGQAWNSEAASLVLCFYIENLQSRAQGKDHHGRHWRFGGGSSCKCHASDGLGT